VHPSFKPFNKKPQAPYYAAVYELGMEDKFISLETDDPAHAIKKGYWLYLDGRWHLPYVYGDAEKTMGYSIRPGEIVVVEPDCTKCRMTSEQFKQEFVPAQQPEEGE
jgi:hypothetical protein